TPARTHWAAPLLGENSQEILCEMGWSREQVDAMRERGIIG
ncbi:MAG: crotonobetainyl-CoA:carnitine CoA-transferase CaiB-like acyl-CoA transferase, partial [Candidatus Latescibacterota bacterium]